MDGYLQESSFENNFSQDERLSFEKLNPLTSKLNEPETNSSGGGSFECNICLDLVRDPVVTFCGHLYCWPCIYRWISSQNENPENHKPNCPVCKMEVSQKTIIPLYGRGQTTSSSKDEVTRFGALIPQRPSSPRCGGNNLLLPNNGTANHMQLPPHRSNYAQPSYYTGTSQLADPMIGMFGEMVYSRIFGNSETDLYSYPNSYHLAGSSSPRVRRRIMQTDRSLSRVCFFLCCCVMLCLLLF